MRRRCAPLALFSLALVLGSCARVVPPSAPLPQPSAPLPAPPAPPPPPVPAPPPPESAVAAGVRAGPAVAALNISEDAERLALTAFRLSCPALRARADPSGLTQSDDWRAACGDQRGAGAGFFAAHFVAVEVGDGAAFATGYYEPEIRASREWRRGYEVPVYAVPPDLLEVNPLTGVRARGRLDESGAFVPYHDRAAIEGGAIGGRGLEIAWARDPIDLFFLQVQGSGRLNLGEGEVMRIGYAGQNGHAYTAIGRLLRERGIIPTGVTMQRIVEWLQAHPEEGRALMRENRSYVFFRELTGAGPLGALGVPVTPRASVATDPRFVPLGAPVVLSAMDRAETNGLWIAQDTGGAIRGANRFDTFWGPGAEAAVIAGGMQARGRALILIPHASWERLRNAAAQR